MQTLHTYVKPQPTPYRPPNFPLQYRAPISSSLHSHCWDHNLQARWACALNARFKVHLEQKGPDSWKLYLEKTDKSHGFQDTLYIKNKLKHFLQTCWGAYMYAKHISQGFCPQTMISCFGSMANSVLASDVGSWGFFLSPPSVWNSLCPTVKWGSCLTRIIKMWTWKIITDDEALEIVFLPSFKSF